MIPSPNCSGRNGARVIWVVIHTAEGATDVGGLGNFFARVATQASSHVGIDDQRIEQYVDYSQAAWTIRGGNTRSDNAELCGFAAWSRDTWLTQHRGMLNLAAGWIRERCLARGIPIIKLSPSDVAMGRAGVIGHIDYTLGARDGTHTDPGDGWPWDVVIQMAAQGAAPAPAEDDPLMALSPQDQALIVEGSRSVLFGRTGIRNPGDLAIAVDETRQRLVGVETKVDAILSRLLAGPTKLDAPLDVTQASTGTDPELVRAIATEVAKMLGVTPPI